MPQSSSARNPCIPYTPTLGRMVDVDASPEYEPQRARIKPSATCQPQTDFQPAEPVHMTRARPIAVSNADYQGPDPYVEYSRRFTAEGGVKLTYRTVDDSIWLTILAVLAWLGLMATSGYLLLTMPPFSPWPEGCYLNQPCRADFSGAAVILDLLLFIVIGWVFAWLLFDDVWVSRSIEIRPDCFILDEVEVFWAQNFESLPAFRAKDEDTQVLAATYGTRAVDLLEVKAFDEADRTQDVLVNHINIAIQQLWFRPPT